jgi:hypothetical protein
MSRTGRRLPEPPAEPAGSSVIRGDEEDDFDATDPEEEEDEYEDDASDVNNPDIVNLGSGPKIGGGYGGRGRRGGGFGDDADHVLGRATSPKLYAAAAQFPTCVQLRVWKWENGVPVSLGTIDAEATEEDFVRQFFSAMPRRGEARAQFRLRPIDIRGQELGQESTTIISEHHGALRGLREAEEDEKEMRMYGRGGGRYGRGEEHGSGGTPQVVVEAPAGGGGTEQMGHVMDRMLEVVEARSRALEEALEMERERVREEEKQRAQERIDLATNAAQGVQSVTDRLMKDEAGRQERALRMQQEQSQLVLTTITTQFQQSQQMAAQMAEERRRQDEHRLEQERQRAERERQDTEARLRREREESEVKRLREREEAELRLREAREEAKARFEQQKMELELRVSREREELERKDKRERDEREARERWFAEERTRREEREAREAKEREEARLRREMMEREFMERRERVEREELRLREADRERKERLEREEKERREALLKEELREREAERQRQHELRVKEMEAQALRDREHAERMASMARLELEAKSNVAGADPLANTMKLFSQFGIPPEEVFPRMFGVKGAGGDEDEDGEKKEAGWMAALPMALGALGEVAKAMSARGAVPPPMPPRAPAAPPQYPQGGPPPRAAFAPTPQGQRPIQRSLPPPPPEFAPSPQRERVPVEVATNDAAPVVRQAVEAASEAETTVEEAQPAPRALSTSERASAAGMNLKAIKAARVGLRALVKKVSAADEEKWEELIGTAIMSEANIYYYVKATNVRDAMLEAGADEELTKRVSAAMRTSSIVPSDLPYGDDGGSQA